MESHYTNRLVLRVNEVFHDQQGLNYEHIHPEIFSEESRRWDLLMNKFIKPIERPLRCIDIGCGTGFISTKLLKYLKKGSSILCADISETMIHICKEALHNKSASIHIETLKMHNEVLGQENNTADIILINSVLHHIPDYNLLLRECARVLKPGGMLMIGHEPNIRFWNNDFLRKQYITFLSLSPKRIAAKLLKLLGLYAYVSSEEADTFIDTLNKILLEEKTISSPLSKTEMSRIIDIHSPTAGGRLGKNGFDPFALIQNLPMEVLFLETYNHASKMSSFGFLKPYMAILKSFFPYSGATFCMVMQK